MDIKQNRYYFSDLLRVLAIFGAIMIHVSASRINQVPIDSMEFYTLNAYDSISRFCVPIFVMLSGMLFLNPNKDVSTKKIVTKYIPRIALALLFFGTVYTVLISYLETGVMDPRFINDGICSVLSGSARYHLWYLYMIIGLYLITPILRIYTAKANKKEIEYFLLLFLIIIGILYPLEKFSYFYNLTHLISLLDITFISGYLGYFLLGYYLNTFSLSLWTTRLVYFLGFLSIPFTFIATQILSETTKTPNFTFYSYFSLNVILMSAAIFLFFKNYFMDKTITERHSKFIAYASKLTFTMYLIHDFFLIGFSRLGNSTLTFLPFISPFMLSVCVFLLSFIFSIIINSIYNLLFRYKYIR